MLLLNQVGSKVLYASRLYDLPLAVGTLLFVHGRGDQEEEVPPVDTE